MMRTILFDIGNVLVGYDHARTVHALAALFDVLPARAGAAYAEIGREFGLGRLSPDEVCAFLNKRLGGEVLLPHFVTAFYAGLMRDDGAFAYASQLQRIGGFQVGAISNTNALHVAWLDAHVPELDTFDLVMMSNEVHLLKPDPAIFELALELLDTAPEQVLFIDDLAENIVAAQSLGMAGIIHEHWSHTWLQLNAWSAARGGETAPA